MALLHFYNADSIVGKALAVHCPLIICYGALQSSFVEIFCAWSLVVDREKSLTNWYPPQFGASTRSSWGRVLDYAFSSFHAVAMESLTEGVT